jgi:hypothetical protein
VVPTVLRSEPYRFFFYSGDRDEPPHVHVKHDDSEAKYWLEPVCLERSRGFARKEISQIQATVEENRQLRLDRWHEYFNG